MLQVQDVGSFILIKDENSYTDLINFIGFEDDAIGETNNLYFHKEFRFSKNKCEWSTFMDLNETNLQNIKIIPSDFIYFEYKYTLVGINNDFNILSLSFIKIIAKQKKTDNFRNVKLGDINCFSCSINHDNIDNQYYTKFKNVLSAPNCTNNLTDFYNSNQNLQQELSNIINQNFGHDVKYYISTPSSNDIILKQWTLYKVECGVNFKVIVPQNEFPDSQIKYDPFGMQFETTFEIHIDKNFFHETFGLTKEPQKGDIMYFTDLKINRIYEINSTYLFNSYNGNPLYYKISLIKYEPRINRDMSNTNDDISDLTISFDDIFDQQKQKIFDNHSKPLEYSFNNIQRNIISNSILNNNLLSNGHIVVSKAFYNLNSTLTYNNHLVSYKPTLNLNELNNISIVFWMKQIKSNNPENLIFGTNSDDGLKIIYKKISNTFDIILNNQLFTFNNVNNLVLNQWYGLILNIGNTVNQLTLGISKPIGNKFALNETTYKQSINISNSNKINLANTNNYCGFFASEFHVTNLRIFNSILNENHWNKVLNQYIVQDSSKLILLDNMEKDFHLDKISKPL